jgi:cyclic pyranopterin phosphate synthase
MPRSEPSWVPRDTLLTFEEIAAIAAAAVRHGITAFKITGGEPLVRRDLPGLLTMLKSLPGGGDLSMTTNGSLLERQATNLRSAGLGRLTISMDTLDGGTFREITQGGDIDRVWRGIRAARDAGFDPPKINCVALRGINDNEFADFAALTRDTALTVRFIEYMPLGRSALAGDYEDRFISELEIRERITRRLGRLERVAKDPGCGPASVWRLEGAAGKIGFISAMSEPFCQSCNRLRLTAEGRLRSCLFDGGEVELLPIVRPASPTARRPIARGLHDAFLKCVAFKPQVHASNGNHQMSRLGG